MDQDLLKQSDIQKIAAEGSKIYQKIKVNYEPKENGKFLAIDIDSQNVYLGNTSAEAVEKAAAVYPGKVFYVVKIGFGSVETMANSIIHTKMY
jgi:hypothetical protein